MFLFQKGFTEKNRAYSFVVENRLNHAALLQ